jgi:hypothetical protein
VSKAVERKQSNEADTGAALETIITKNLINHHQINPTQRCLLKQKADEASISRIDKKLKEQFANAAIKIAAYIEKKFIHNNSFEIDRTDDGDESVEDIVLKNQSQRINFSIKHNNDSIKHNRPFSLVTNGLGFERNSSEDSEHRERLIKKCNEFRERFPLAKKFPDLTMDAKEDLYYQLISECKYSLEKYKNNSRAAQNLFSFIMGKDYIKIKVITPRTKDSFAILYEDFREDATNPKTYKITRVWKGKRKGAKCASWNFEITFDNKYKFTHRIHNGSSRINQKDNSQISMKFDVKFAEDSVRGKKIT